MRKHFCNICGKEFDEWDSLNGFSVDVYPGYGSKYDGDNVQMDICCACFDKMVDVLTEKCVYNPVVRL